MATSRVTFPSAFVTPHPENNIVRCAISSARLEDRRAGLTHWNANPDAYVGLCRLLAWSGMSALRLSLPYHDERTPPELLAPTSS